MSPRALAAGVALVSALAATAACDGRAHVELHLRVAEGTHPLAGADAVTLSFADATGAPLATRRVPASDDALALDAPVVEGTLTATLLATRGVDAVARGRTCPFAAPAATAGLTLELPLQPIGQFEPGVESPLALDGAALLALGGELLLVGGSDSAGAPLRASQRYQPGPGRFSDGPMPSRARTNAQAIALSDGTALILGGGAPAPGALGAERLVAGRFFELAAPFPADWRAGRAVELAPRVVLVAGGGIGGVARADTLLITLGDGGEAIVDSVGPLAEARVDLTLTALSTGAALAAGGVGPSGPSDALELFDASNNGFTPLGPRLRAARAGHSATRLSDGRVLIAGGRGAGGTALATLELVDPARRAVLPGGTLATARAGHAAIALPDGRVLLAGGTGADGAPLADAELWDPALGASGEAVPTGSLSTGRATPTIAPLCDGTFFVAGGAASVEAYAAP